MLRSAIFWQNQIQFVKRHYKENPVRADQRILDIIADIEAEMQVLRGIDQELNDD